MKQFIVLLLRSAPLFLYSSFVAAAQEPNQDMTIYTHAKLHKLYYDHQEVIFSWRNSDIAEFYVLQISRDPEYRDIIISRKVQSNKTTVSFSEQFLKKNIGTFYWRVLIKKEDNKVLVSNNRTFSINKSIHNSNKTKSQNFASAKSHKTSIFYTVSQGTLSENGATDATLIQSQNSPATLGMMFSAPFNKNWSYSTSFYGSYFTPVQVKDSTKVLTIPPELGGNFYLANKIYRTWSLYAGYDYERLYTFNLDEVEAGLEESAIKEQQMHYATLGVEKRFDLFSRSSLFKTSFSAIVANTGEKNKYNNKNLTGHKAILFLSHNIFKKFSLQAFFKTHQLTGSSDITINRFGMGASYSF